MHRLLAGPLFSALEAKLPELPRKQQVLARTILETPELVALGSVRDLSAQLQMNNATIIRFAKSLGFTGYQELQAAVREAYLARSGARTARGLPAGDEDGAVAATFARQQANLQLVWEQLDEAELATIAQALIDAGRIVVFTTGAAVVPGMMLVRLLRHVGLRGELIGAPGVERVIGLHDLAPGDVLVAIGLWLAFGEPLQALTMARGRGATTVAIMGSPASPLGRAADYTLLAPAQAVNLPMSVVATVAVVELLAAAIASLRPEIQQAIEAELHQLYLDEDLLAPAFPRPASKATI